jgi:hypothetical protein
MRCREGQAPSGTPPLSGTFGAPSHSTRHARAESLLTAIPGLVEERAG